MVRDIVGHHPYCMASCRDVPTLRKYMHHHGGSYMVALQSGSGRIATIWVHFKAEEDALPALLQSGSGRIQLYCFTSKRKWTHAAIWPCLHHGTQFLMSIVVGNHPYACGHAGMCPVLLRNANFPHLHHGTYFTMGRVVGHSPYACSHAGMCPILWSKC